MGHIKILNKQAIELKS